MVLLALFRPWAVADDFVPQIEAPFPWVPIGICWRANRFVAPKLFPEHLPPPFSMMDLGTYGFLQ